MQRRYAEQTIMSFLLHCHSEKWCEDYFIRVRWPEGMQCLRCKEKDFSPRLPKRWAYQCRGCRKFLYPTTGTVFHSSQASLMQWFIAIFFMATDKRGLSALYLSEQIEVHYETAWSMLQRIRQAMAKRDAIYKLGTHVEMDEMFIGAPTEGKKRGRGTEKTPVLVAVSYVPAGEGKEYMGFAKMRAVKKITEETIVAFAKDALEPGSLVRSDGLSVYPPLEKHGFMHDRNPVGKRKAHVILPHVHLFISNLKAFVQGTAHGLDDTRLQHYLDEFCWRFNRRRHRKELFDRLLLACLEKEGIPDAALFR
jgi:transposase-like protein